MSDTNRTSKTDLKAELAKYLPLAKSHLLLIAHREDLSISADAKARLAELEALERELRQPVETAGVQVAGDTLPTALWQFEQRANVLLSDEQAKANPDNALIGFICDAVRLARENERLARSPLEPFARQPADCKHERASLKCADCGVDFIGTLKQQEKPFAKPDPRGDTAIWVLAWLARQGGLGHDKHRVIDAVMEGRATMRADGTLHIEPKSPEKASGERCINWPCALPREHTGPCSSSPENGDGDV